ncbi:MAG: M48 family metalloprotease [Minisyncoccia bacterium]
MTLYTQAASNIRKTWLFMTLFLVFVIFLGWIFSYLFNEQWILFIAVALAITQSFLSYWNSDKIILSLSQAQGPLQKGDNPELYRLVENLSITAGLPMPKVYIINDVSPNAFATGRDPQHAAICVTSGLLNKLDKVELEGVVSHELSHIGNRDILLDSVIVVLVGVISLLSNWLIREMAFGGERRREKNDNLEFIFLILGLLAALFAPLAATLLQLAISRKREFLADANGALLTRYPEGLARALEKIANDPNPLRTASQATAHLFIADPLKPKKISWFSNLWQTHPPIEERIKVLREMDGDK